MSVKSQSQIILNSIVKSDKKQRIVLLLFSFYIIIIGIDALGEVVKRTEALQYLTDISNDINKEITINPIGKESDRLKEKLNNIEKQKENLVFLTIDGDTTGELSFRSVISGIAVIDLEKKVVILELLAVFFSGMS